MDNQGYPSQSAAYHIDQNPGNPGYGPPVVQQPSHNTTVVVTGGPVQTSRPMRTWSTGLFGCFEDIGSCLLVAFCMECYGYYLASRAGEQCCLPCLFPGWLIALRAHIRGKHNIQGSIAGDCCTVAHCYPCAMCQLSREIDNVNKGTAPQ